MTVCDISKLKVCKTSTWEDWGLNVFFNVTAIYNLRHKKSIHSQSAWCTCFTLWVISLTPNGFVYPSVHLSLYLLYLLNRLISRRSTCKTYLFIERKKSKKKLQRCVACWGRDALYLLYSIHKSTDLFVSLATRVQMKIMSNKTFNYLFALWIKLRQWTGPLQRPPMIHWLCKFIYVGLHVLLWHGADDKSVVQ